MKRFYLFLMVAILVSIASLANSETGESKLTQLFPGATVVWQKTLHGILTDFVIAKDSGYVAISTMEGPSGNRKGYVYFFAPDGRLLWQLSNESNTGLKTVYDINLSLSDNGKTLLVDWWGDYESSEKQIYDKSGRFLFKNYDNKMGFVGYSVSPDGEYFTPGLFRRDGTKVDFSPLDPQKWHFDFYRFPIRFLSKDEISVIARERFSKGALQEYSKKWLKERRTELSKSQLSPEERRKKERMYDDIERMLSYGYNRPAHVPSPPEKRQLCISPFPDGKLKWKLDLGVNGWARVKRVDNCLFVQSGGETGEILRCFADDGTELWKRDGFYYLREYVDSFKKGKYYAIFDNRYHRLHILDGKTGFVLITDTLIPQDRLGPIYSFLCSENMIMLSGELFFRLQDLPPPRSWNRTYIWQFSDDLKILDEGLVNGSVIGRSDSKFIGIYKSDSERMDAELRKSCTDFQVSILKGGVSNDGPKSD